MNKKINIHFLGDTFTGSKYLVEALDKIIMIDCGQFLQAEDWAELDLLVPPVGIAQIDLVVFPCTQANQNDCLPALTKAGFEGQILCAASPQQTHQQ